MYKVTITDVVKPVAPEEAILRENGATLIYGDGKTEEELIGLLQDADAIINAYALLTANVINSLQRCQVIVRRGIGYENIDLAAATAKGIPIANVPDYCIDEVADHAMALLLCCARKVIPSREHVKAGQWNFRQFAPLSALRESVLGLVGFGRISRAVAARARCFGIKVQTSDPFISAEFASAHDATLVSLAELLRSSDFISLHVPLTSDTCGMFSKREFAMMKPRAVFINTSRGPAVNEEALREALQSGKIAFAALDVLTEEPPLPDNPLLKMDNVIITPHLAWFSERSLREVGEKTAQEIVRVFKGYFPHSLVNPEVIKNRPDLKQADFSGKNNH